MKFIVIKHKGQEVIFLFSKIINHDRFAEGMESIRFGDRHDWSRDLREGDIISAGFVDGGVCHGKSESLGIKARGKEDTKLLLSLICK